MRRCEGLCFRFVKVGNHVCADAQSLLCVNCLAVADSEERQRFARSVKVEDIKVSRLGTWTWSPEKPAPSMESLYSADFWTKDKFAELRESFAHWRKKAISNLDPNTGAGEVIVPKDDEGHRMVVYKATAPIPPGATEIPVALIVIQAETETQTGSRIR